MDRGVEGEHANRDVKGAVTFVPVSCFNVIVVVQIITIIVVVIVVVVIKITPTRGNWPLFHGTTGSPPVTRVSRITPLTMTISEKGNKGQMEQLRLLFEIITIIVRLSFSIR